MDFIESPDGKELSVTNRRGEKIKLMDRSMEAKDVMVSYIVSITGGALFFLFRLYCYGLNPLRYFSLPKGVYLSQISPEEIFIRSVQVFCIEIILSILLSMVLFIVVLIITTTIRMKQNGVFKKIKDALKE